MTGVDCIFLKDHIQITPVDVDDATVPGPIAFGHPHHGSRPSQ